MPLHALVDYFGVALLILLILHFGIDIKLVRPSRGAFKTAHINTNWLVLWSLDEGSMPTHIHISIGLGLRGL